MTSSFYSRPIVKKDFISGNTRCNSQISINNKRNYSKCSNLTIDTLKIILSSCLFLVCGNIFAQNIPQKDFLSKEDFEFLKDLTKDVLESSKLYHGQRISEKHGPNNTGGILIRSGGRNAYPFFLIRDYARSLDCGSVSPEDQKHMLFLTASIQCDQTWITKGGNMVPYGAIADRVRIDDKLPIYFPRASDYIKQGHSSKFGKIPPISDQFYFIHMGKIRHILMSDDFDETTAWETEIAEKNHYQNGA